MGSDARSAADWHLRHRSTERSFASQAAAVVAVVPPGPVLDLGCGTAPLADYLDPRRNAWTGLERDPAMAAGAVRRRSRSPARAVLGDALRLPFRDGAFTSVVALGLFEYLSDPPTTLREAARVTAPGGAIVLTVPRRDSLYRRGLVAAAPLLKLAGRVDPFDLESGRRVTPADAARWGRAAGVRLATVRPVAPALLPWPLDRLLVRAVRRFDRKPGRRGPSQTAPPGENRRLGTAWLFCYACPVAAGEGEWRS